MKLGLGTVQFGADYGISNAAGQTPAGEVAGILALARESRVTLIDTAALYGSSEELLGRALPAGHPFKLVTKTIRIDTGKVGAAEVARVAQGVQSSLQKLRCRALYALLLHNVDDLFLENGHLLFEKMQELKQRGVVEKIGVSVYTARQIERVLERHPVDVVQLPINVLDQRLLLDGHLDRLKEAGVEIHARSVFLQGLLLMEPQELPPWFDPIRGRLAKYRDMLSGRRLSPVAAALGFVAGLEQVDYAICGVNDRNQLKEICAACAPLPAAIFTEFACDREEMLNPAKWRVK